MSEEVRNWGYSLSLDVSGCDHKSICSYEVIREFNIELVKRIEMVAFGEPHLVHFGSGNKLGYTSVQLIQTSSIVAHFVEENDTFYIDVFSCRTFEIEKVKQCVRDYFGQESSMKEHYFERQA
jgi:S-adenosylmethionine decarboxylase